MTWNFFYKKLGVDRQERHACVPRRRCFGDFGEVITVAAKRSLIMVGEDEDQCTPHLHYEFNVERFFSFAAS